MRRSIPALVLLLCSCSLGTRTMRDQYVDFNQTLQYNQNQQMLLNLVRMKYRESPLFLKVGALSSSYDFAASASASLGKTTTSRSAGVGFNSSYSVRPTITYTPIEGNTYVRQVLAEIDDETFALLLRSGWPVKTLCNVMVERIGKAMNNEDAATYADFEKIVDLLQEAQSLGALDVVTREKDIVLRVSGNPHPLPGEKKGRETIIPLSSFQLRSFLDVMFFLGKNTQVPEEQRNQVRGSRNNGWINIVSSAKEPDNALVWVKYQGYYFSIPATDVRSKDTFALLRLLFQIQAGDIKTVQPILTLPVVQ